jgi:pimeloyl-ACP methyl ester carboxylesterase
VVLPGAWAHALTWPPSLIEALSSRFRVFSVDNICDVGRSVSSRPLDTAADFTWWLDGLLDALGLADGVNLMGISRGGWITAEYLLHAPQRVAKAVLLSPALVVIGPSSKSFRSSPYSLTTIISPSVWSVRGLMRHLMPFWADSE